jgi:oligopeptide transport system substrate-binding protein
MAVADNSEASPLLRPFDDAEQIDRFARRLAAVQIDRRQALRIFAAAGGAAGLAACGSNRQSAAPQPLAPPHAATSSSGPEQTFRWNLEVEPASQDYNADLHCDGDYELWAGLMRFTPDLTPEPDMAVSFDVNADATVYTFHMRPNTTWTDGSPVTARDFDYSFRRTLNPATKNDYASFLYDIKNAQAYNSGKLANDSTLGLQMLDESTLRITLEATAAYFPALLAYAAAFPANRAAVEKYGDKWTEAGNIVSNGPFKLTRWDHNTTLELAKHDGYWDAKNIHLTRIVRPIMAAEQAVAAFENGELDWVQNINPSDFQKVMSTPTLKQQTVSFFLDGTWYLVPEVDKKPFDLLNVRLAMAHAIDRDALVKNALQGLGQPAFTLIPPGTPGFNPEKYDDYTAYDPQKAMALLKGTPYEGGKNWPPITMSQRIQGEAEKVAGDAVIQMLHDNLGMQIDHEVGDPKDVYERMYERKLQLIWIRWYEDYPDQSDEQNLVFWSQAGGANGHRQAWHDDNYDKLVVAAKSETDPQKRTQMYYQADAILAQQAGAIFVYYPQYLGLLRANVTGMPHDKSGNAVPTLNLFVRMYDTLRVTS